MEGVSGWASELASEQVSEFAIITNNPFITLCVLMGKKVHEPQAAHMTGAYNSLSVA